MRDFQLVLKRAPKDENALKKKDECDKVRAACVCETGRGSHQMHVSAVIHELSVHVWSSVIWQRQVLRARAFEKAIESDSSKPISQTLDLVRSSQHLFLVFCFQRDVRLFVVLC
jgi:hypothetical protein